MSNEEIAILELRKIVTIRRNIIIRAANSELINLFWQIGTQIKQIRTAFSKVRVDIPTISNILRKQYRNNFFSSSQLRKMELFVELFPNTDEVKTISYFLNWKHILLFLKIKDNKIRNYYVKLAIQNDFNPKDLEAKMKESLGKVTSLIRVNSLHLTYKKTRDTKTVLDSLVQTTNKPPKCKNIESIFEEPLFSFYRSLTNHKNNSSRNFQYKKKPSKSLTDVFTKEVFQQIKNFGQQQNFLINGNLNLLLWEISKFINEEHSGKPHDVNERTEIFELIITSKNFDELFTRKELYEIAKFAKEMPDLSIVTWMAHALSWKHIRILLSLENLEAIIYYTALESKKNMNAKALKNVIERNSFNARSHKNTIDHKLISAFQNPTTRTTIKKTHHTIETITSIDYEFKNIYSISSTIDICKNPWFIKLVKYKTES